MAEVLAEALFRSRQSCRLQDRQKAFPLLTMTSQHLSLGPMNPVVASDKLKRTEVWA